ncbi:Uncharacterised protein [Clostridium beijerinckii]|uniref:hypothetical protein n=1 Tax=Clostridium beijerinckii TaxID=1520 RepID=UPI000D8BB9EA|nr:hypothetical protein [Clostridium beijerinckii]SQB12361.1 Uncharacterised protein [Clostridium beijerinckii]
MELKSYILVVNTNQFQKDINQDEEKDLQDKGLLEIGYGSEKDEIKVSQNQSVMWYEDGLSYCIINMDYTELSKDDMINMAKEVIG